MEEEEEEEEELVIHNEHFLESWSRYIVNYNYYSETQHPKYLINLVKHRNIFKLNDVFSEWVNCFTFKSFVDFPIITVRIYTTFEIITIYYLHFYMSTLLMGCVIQMDFETTTREM